VAGMTRSAENKIVVERFDTLVNEPFRVTISDYL
jgi:hypothetical protein